MDWKIFLSAFVMVFLAELGDKTQLSALAFSAGSKSTWSVFFGACVALILSTFIAVLIGAVLHKQDLLPLSAIRTLAGILFIVFGVFTLHSVWAADNKEKKHKKHIKTEAPAEHHKKKESS
jgi:putative Ca2+/H+ antiporter (TMEM165/GDT1 family)